MRLLWLVPCTPLFSATLLMLVGRRLPRWLAGTIGVVSIGLSAAFALLVDARYLQAAAGTSAFTQHLWTWMAIGSFRPTVSLRLDSLSATMIATVSGVGFLIHLYSAEHMREDEGYSRFFAYMNLFVSAMLVLVLADDLVLLFLGWEGVGLCSYLLIGFWYREPANGAAARKAFLVTRVGDTAMILGLVLLYVSLGSTHIQTVMSRAQTQWSVGAAPALAAALLMLGGALGKSAQLPLQTWLPDAMAGPTPTSALIHAATMVTAGVYLIARLHVLFELAPVAMHLVAYLGAATLVLAATSALFQTDIKRILAYSTMSQIGYMFLALGAGAWSAAIFHLVTHAFFKALLFLAAGVVIQAMHEEHNIYRMGGLARRAPVAFTAFIVGGAALAGLPLVTSGAYSKELILWQVWSSGLGQGWLWGVGMAGVLLTTLYILRLILHVFLGPEQGTARELCGWPVRAAIYVLSFLSVLGGALAFTRPGGTFPILIGFLQSVLPAGPVRPGSTLTEASSNLVSAGLLGVGVLVAYLARHREAPGTERESGLVRRLFQFWRAGWAFDWLYEWCLVRPYRWLARLTASDLIDWLYFVLAEAVRLCHGLLSRSESGQLRAYAAGVAIGAVALLALVLLR